MKRSKNDIIEELGNCSKLFTQCIFSFAFDSLRRSSLQNYAMQQAFKTLASQMPTQNNQFNNAGFASNMPFPFPPPPAPSTATSPPPSSTVASKPVTVDVSASKVEETPATDIKDSSEPKQEPKKYGTNYLFDVTFALN